MGWRLISRWAQYRPTFRASQRANWVSLFSTPGSYRGVSVVPVGAKYTDQVRCRLVAAGVLSWLGLDKQKHEPDSDLVITIKRGVLAAQEGDLKRADQMFHIALKMAIDLGHEEGITHIYCLMANTAMEQGFFGQAERTFNQVLRRILSNGEPQDSNAVVEISLKLAQIFLAQKDIPKAEQGFEFCKKTQQIKVEKEGEDCSEDTLALYGLSLDQQGQFLLGQSRLAESEACFAAAVKISTRLHGDNHEQTLVIENSLATVISLNGDTDRAIHLLNHIIIKAKQSSSEYLPTFLINRGVLFLRKGLVDQAREDCSSAKSEAVAKHNEEAIVEADQCLREILALSSR